MRDRLIVATALLATLALPGAGNLTAQEVDIGELRKQIQVYTGVLQEGLSLDSTPGFLGIRSGRVNSVYLRNQGVLFEIRTPLASQRNRVSLNTLASSIRGISAGSNPFEAMIRARENPAPNESSVLGQANELARQTVRSSAETLRAIDYQAAVDAAIREAYRGARMLQDIGSMDESAMADLGQELDALSQQLRDSLQQLRQLDEASATDTTATDTTTIDTTTTDTTATSTTAAESQSPGSESLERVRNTMQELAEQAQRKAAEIDRQYQQARADYRQRWLAEVATFEDSLFGLLCDFGATLRDLPADENVTVVLVGLGADSDQALPADRLHVVAKSDLLACQSGELDWQDLQQRAASYNY